MSEQNQLNVERNTWLVRLISGVAILTIPMSIPYVSSLMLIVLSSIMIFCSIVYYILMTAFWLIDRGSAANDSSYADLRVAKEKVRSGDAALSLVVIHPLLWGLGVYTLLTGGGLVTLIGGFVLPWTVASTVQLFLRATRNSVGG